ncbi:glycosyltransferase [Candidatus Bathyarchaeota archaeon]|nr:glycosyltransferase [Candidatus Bathyarchaeota archaeon]
MNVLVVTPSYPRYLGDYNGAFVQSQCRELSRYVELSVLAPRSRTLEHYSEKFEVRRFPYLPYKRMEFIAEQTMKGAPYPILSTLPLYLTSAFANIVASKETLIHLHIAIPLGVPVIQAKKSRPVIITCHGSDITYTVEKSILRPICRNILRQASTVVTVSRYLQGLLGSLEVNSRVLPIGIDVKRFSPVKRKQGSTINIGVLGRLVPEKRVQDTLKAMKLIEKKLDCHIHIAGDGPELYKLKRLSERYGVKSIFHGRVQYPEKFLGKCDVFVLSSIREGLSTSLQEAMASGCTPVAVNHYGCDELVKHGENGYLFKPGNIPDLAECIQMAAEKPELGKKARKTILQNHDIEKNTLRYLEEYKKLME